MGDFVGVDSCHPMVVTFQDHETRCRNEAVEVFADRERADRVVRGPDQQRRCAQVPERFGGIWVVVPHPRRVGRVRCS